METTPRRGEVFSASLAPYMSRRDLESVETAYTFSKYGHSKQLRDDGTRYFEHPRAVAVFIVEELRIRDAKAIVEALLHDIKEDSFILSEYRIALNFGDDVSWDVRLLTKDPLSKPIYYPRLKECARWRPLVVKIADRIHNLRTLSDCPRAKQLKQVAETRMHFFELCTILERYIPAEFAHAIPVLRAELERLCMMYE